MLWYYAKLYKKFFWSGLFFLALTDVFDVIPPLIMLRAINEITRGAPIHDLLITASIFGVVTLSLAFVRYHWRMQYGKFHQSLARDLRGRVFQKLTELGPTFYAKNPVGELMSLMTNDVETIRMGMGPGLAIIIDAILYLVMIPPLMIWISPSLTWKTLILLPFLPFFINWLSGIIHRRYITVQEAFSEMSGITAENIGGIRIVKSYVQEKNQIDIFNGTSRKWKDENLKVAVAETFMHPVMEVCVSVGMVALLYFGSKDILSGAVTIGAFVAIQRYVLKMVWPMTAIGWGINLISQGRASLDRIEEFLATPLDVKIIIQEAHHNNMNLKGPIEIRDLSFMYPKAESYALKNLNLKIEEGETFGIVGPVGSGKTTLAQLLCHLFEVGKGKMLFNGHDITEIPLPLLRNHITFVPQDTFLFSTSITENMAFGIDTLPTTEALIRIAQIAKLDEEIENLPYQYETYLGERGVNLSGGQKQRMTITRALLRKSPIIIFDDSLSAVDAETENLILKRLQDETKNNTTIIISHRLSSLSLCDRIIVLKQGAIEAIGTPLELRSRSDTYRELLQLQGYV